MTEADFLSALRGLPLHRGASELRDDTAQVVGLTITTDTIVEGVHFLPGDPPEDVAWKLLAVNLSDLAAKGALIEGVLLNYPLSRTERPTPAEAGVQLRADDGEGQSEETASAEAGPRPSPGWDERFLLGFGEAIAHFGAPLIGGDTVSLPPGAPRVLTLTAIGRDAAALPRSGARAGDTLWVTGTIGDAGAGLRIARGEAGPEALLAAYRRPAPRLAEGRALAPLAHAMMDVSDGLLIDAARMAEASQLALTIELGAIPLSADYVDFAGGELDARIAAATAGDDYELLFAMPAGETPPVAAACVGSFTPGSGLTITYRADPVPLPSTLGFQH